MIRSSKAIAAAVLLFVMPTVASALGISIVNVSSTGASPTYLLNGDEITFDLRLENATGVGVAGLDVVVSGFDTAGTTNAISSGLQLVGGAVTTSAFNQNLPVLPDLSDQGLENQRLAPVNVWALSLTNPQEVRTSLFAGIDTLNRTGTGDNDPAIGGGSTATGIHFRVTYRLVGVGSIAARNYTLSFGTNAVAGEIAIDRFGNELPFQNASYALTVIPEPGTALLMGLGLAALATRRR